ncbi:unnamed protein product [Clonostachys chloroleuca]|uniref:lytic cellulose monooxygenase (C4-dehydrogenating) n=2 Tax=Clonostachys chloroleuca TaxID=1926264 RepID=A0AA35PWY0_9HYPO|nr:unnamed protein product [Clonostachys chloroleuca]
MHRSLLLSSLLAMEVAAHGFVKTFTLDGVDHEGFWRWNTNPDPKAIGWSFTTPDEGPILDISNPDLSCRQDSAPAKNYGQIAAGGKADFFWTSEDKVINPNGWAESHRGPIMTYIAPCNGDCTTVDKATLKWTKIYEEGLISGTANTNGVWASDKMRENGGINSATIPSSIAPGKYVIRNEIIALHRAHINEPEFYAQCANIEVTGSGTDDLSGKGVIATQLYKTTDNVFGFDVYNVGKETTWPIPGPPVYSAADSGNTDNVSNAPSSTSIASSTSVPSAPSTTISTSTVSSTSVSRSTSVASAPTTAVTTSTASATSTSSPGNSSGNDDNNDNGSGCKGGRGRKGVKSFRA